MNPTNCGEILAKRRHVSKQSQSRTLSLHQNGSANLISLDLGDLLLYLVLRSDPLAIFALALALLGSGDGEGQTRTNRRPSQGLRSDRRDRSGVRVRIHHGARGAFTAGDVGSIKTATMQLQIESLARRLGCEADVELSWSWWGGPGIWGQAAQAWETGVFHPLYWDRASRVLSRVDHLHQ